MKMIVTTFAFVAAFGSIAQAQSPELEILRGNHLEQERLEQVRPGTAFEIERQVTASIKQKCNKNGCVVFVDDTTGDEFRIGASAGVGNNGYSNGGITIIDPYGYGRGGDDDLGYQVSVSYIHSKATCRHRVPESVYRYIETYIRLISTPQFAEKVMRKAEVGEDMPMPEPIKLAFMTLASIKPSQGQCTFNDARGR